MVDRPILFTRSNGASVAQWTQDAVATMTDHQSNLACADACQALKTGDVLNSED